MAQYARIVKEFGYDPDRDRRAANRLNDILDREPDVGFLSDTIRGKTILCVGSGPSLIVSTDIIRDTSDIVVIAADSAVLPLIQNGVTPDMIVSDLDGDLDALMIMAGRNVPYIIHAHGDNIDRLDMSYQMPVCAGTTQAEPVGHIQNWGGFTDGDRAVFLASHFGADRIILCGMDLNGPVSVWSGYTDKMIKQRKLNMAAHLLEWLATFTDSGLYTLSHPLRGFRKINNISDIDR